MNPCDIEKLGFESYSITHEGKKKTCLLFVSEKNYENKIDSIDIVLAFLKPKKIPFAFQTILVIKEKIIVGPVGEVEIMIMEFFRRKGIRFYKK
jgi:hypothetical protein